jgi:gamma-D-glutamyl-L-lysine dipeptidyl-peptidase
MTTYVISTAIADVRAHPDPTSELVTQALMNTPVKLGENSGEWTFITLSDYEGWVRNDELEEPIVKGFCKVGDCCGTPLHFVAVINTTRTPLYSDSKSDNVLGYAYLSTMLPLRDITEASRVQVALPGERTAWLARVTVEISKQKTAFSRSSVAAITRYARGFLGVSYLWGGTSYEGIDCSGFTQLCYRMGGYVIPRDAHQQHAFLRQSVDRNHLQEGDLIFFGRREITHVALALNNQEYIHSEGQLYNCVTINSFDPTNDHYDYRLDEIYWGAKRVIE